MMERKLLLVAALALIGVLSQASTGNARSDGFREALTTSAPSVSQEVPVAPACSSHKDDDGDGLMDMADPGCTRLLDNDEYNPPPPPPGGDGATDSSDGTGGRGRFFAVSDPFPLGLFRDDLVRMQQGNVQWVHTGIQWPQVEPRLGHFNWDRLDNIIGNLASRGIHMFPYVLGSPGYAAKAPNRPPLRSKRARKAWKGFLRALVNRYGPGGQYWTNKALYRRHHPGAARVPITSWQIWHEPNLKKYFHATIGQYAKLLRISHRAIHGADPHAKVILAGLPAYAKPTAWGFLNKLYRQKHIKKDFDGVAVHPYAPSVHLQAVALKRTRRAIKRHHDAHTPIWITELGWGSNPPDRYHLNKGLHGQARYLNNSFRMVLRHRRNWNVKRVFWFRWRDLPAGSKCYGSIACSGGLFTPAGVPKPAWVAFKRFTRG